MTLFTVPPAIRAVVFDLDGTLVDTLPDLTHALQVALVRLQLPAVPDDIVRASLHGGLEGTALATLEILQRTSGHTPLPSYEHLLATYRAAYRDHLWRTSRPYPGVTTMLHTLHSKGLRIALCTNKAETEARHLLRAFALDGCFDAVVGGDTLAMRKPSAEPLLYALALLETQPDAALMVGDSQVDLDCAHTAGVTCNVFTGGYGDLDPTRLAPGQAFTAYTESQPGTPPARTGASLPTLPANT